MRMDSWWSPIDDLYQKFLQLHRIIWGYPFLRQRRLSGKLIKLEELTYNTWVAVVGVRWLAQHNSSLFSETQLWCCWISIRVSSVSSSPLSLSAFVCLHLHLRSPPPLRCLVTMSVRIWWNVSCHHYELVFAPTRTHTLVASVWRARTPGRPCTTPRVPQLALKSDDVDLGWLSMGRLHQQDISVRGP